MKEKMLFICYPKCSTCKKAEKWLKENSISFTVRDIKKERPTLKEIASWHKVSGLPLKRFFNTSGNLYKALQLKEKLQDMNEAEQLKLLASDGMLIKRPILVAKNFVLVGFKEAEWHEKI